VVAKKVLHIKTEHQLLGQLLHKDQFKEELLLEEHLLKSEMLQ
jgi:hypothetical protein